MKNNKKKISNFFFRFRLKKILKNSFKISEDVRGLFFRMMLLHHPVALQSMDNLDQNGFSLL